MLEWMSGGRLMKVIFGASYLRVRKGEVRFAMETY